MADPIPALSSELTTLIARTGRLVDFLVSGVSPPAQQTWALQSFLASLSQALQFFHTTLQTWSIDQISVQSFMSDNLSAISRSLDVLNNDIAPAAQPVYLTSESAQQSDRALTDAIKSDSLQPKIDSLKTNNADIKEEGKSLSSSSQNTQGDTECITDSAKSNRVEKTRRLLQLELNKLFLIFHFMRRYVLSYRV
jgi:hypothetical protein